MADARMDRCRVVFAEHVSHRPLTSFLESSYVVGVHRDVSYHASAPRQARPSQAIKGSATTDHTDTKFTENMQIQTIGVVVPLVDYLRVLGAFLLRILLPSRPSLDLGAG